MNCHELALSVCPLTDMFIFSSHNLWQQSYDFGDLIAQYMLATSLSEALLYLLWKQRKAVFTIMWININLI